MSSFCFLVLWCFLLSFFGVLSSICQCFCKVFLLGNDCQASQTERSKIFATWPGFASCDCFDLETSPSFFKRYLEV